MKLGVPAVALALLAALPPTPLLAADGPPLSRPLTAEAVECHRDKLAGVLLSTGGGVRTPDRRFEVVTLFASPIGSDSTGLLLIGNPWDDLYEREPFPAERRREVHLAATLVSNLRPVLLHPERPLLPQISLIRDDLNSTWRRTDVEAALAVVTVGDPAGGPRVRVDLGAGRSDSGPARSFEAHGVTRSCPGEPTAEDRRVLSVLQRIVRPRYVSIWPHDVNTSDTKVAIYRGEAPDAYRIDVYETMQLETPPPLFDRLATRFALELERDARGRLSTGRLRLLELNDVGTGGQGFETLFFAPPAFPYLELWREDDPRTHAFAVPESFADGPVVVDLAALLAGTTWNPPRE